MNIARDDRVTENLGKKNFYIDCSVKRTCRPFKFLENENGNILNIHNTVQECGKYVRVPMRICAFSDRNTKKFVIIDKRGNTFVFQLISKRYFRHQVVVPNASALQASNHDPNKFLIGTKNGKLLQVNIDKSQEVTAIDVSRNPIIEISFPGNTLQQSKLVLVNTGDAGVIVDMEKCATTHRLDFDPLQFSVKFASFMPFSEHMFTCFTTDVLHIWSGITLNTVNIVTPIRVRDRQIRFGGSKSIPNVELPMTETEKTTTSPIGHLMSDLNYSDGLIFCYCYKPDGTLICIGTVDSYVLILSTITFRMSNILRLNGFVMRECAFMPQSKDMYLICLTTLGKVIIIDVSKANVNMVVQDDQARHIKISMDGKLLAILLENGDVHIWSTDQLFNKMKSQEQCVQILREACKDAEKAAVMTTAPDYLTKEIKNQLKPDRLLAILKEFGTYPAKYRVLIWSALLQLPYNRNEFQLFLSLKKLPMIKTRIMKFRMQNESLKWSLAKIWNCLAHWCKVLAYSDFLPNFIFPFIKCLPKNSALVVFEVCVSLIMNHCQLWFEFHPLTPANYLAMCNNILLHFDPELSTFYASDNIKATTIVFGFSLLSNSFSEVLDEEQWLQMWDHVFSTPPYFLIFCTVAFNIIQREIIIRLPNLSAIQHFFEEQQPIDMTKFLDKAYTLMNQCPENIHPRRYMSEKFIPIPKGVYPKFLNYPKELLVCYEEGMDQLNEEHIQIDERLRQLELEEHKAMKELEQKLKDEEHTKRIKNMQCAYHDVLRREEERVATQRKLLLIYQKEARQRKAQALSAQVASERRKQTMETESDLETLMRDIERQRIRTNDALLMAEDQERQQNFEVYSQQKMAETAKERPNLGEVYESDVNKLRCEGHKIHKILKEQSLTTPCKTIPKNKDSDVPTLVVFAKEFDEIRKEFKKLCKK